MIPVLLALALQTYVVLPTPTGGEVPTPGPILEAPIPVVERIVHLPEGTTRLTLFNNRVAVVSVRPVEGEPLLRRRTLTATEYISYLEAFSQIVEELRAMGSDLNRLSGREPDAFITLNIGAEGPLEVRYNTLQVPGLAVGRLEAVLDDLQTWVRKTPAGYDEIMAWKPREGDRVRMLTGETARVEEVREDGSLILRFEDVGINELVAPSGRTGRIAAILERGTR